MTPFLSLLLLWNNVQALPPAPPPLPEFGVIWLLDPSTRWLLDPSTTALLDDANTTVIWLLDPSTTWKLDPSTIALLN